MYKMNQNGSAQRISDGATIPADLTNRDYAEFLKVRDGWREVTKWKMVGPEPEEGELDLRKQEAAEWIDHPAQPELIAPADPE